MNFHSVVQGFVEDAIEVNKNNKSCHIALLMNGKKVVSFGYNQMGRQCFRGSSVNSLHAEIDCLRKCRPIRDVMGRGYTLVIVKVSKENNGTYYDSMPCKNCKKFLQGLNFKSVYCSNRKGEIVKINLVDYTPYNLNV